jgi:hypothetical protein
MPAIATDTYGDGLTYGNGLSLSFDGTTILSVPLYDTGTVDEYGGSYWAAEMGACGDQIDDDQVDSDDGDTADGSCFDTALTLTTDGYGDEMAVIMFDANDVDANGDPTIIFESDFGSLEDNTEYVVEDMCLDNSGCYAFFLLDIGSDGFLSTGGLEMTVNGETILSVGPGDLGTYDSDLGAMYWEASFGDCNV